MGLLPLKLHADIVQMLTLNRNVEKDVERIVSAEQVKSLKM
jgi:hypothetical protein